MRGPNDNGCGMYSLFRESDTSFFFNQHPFTRLRDILIESA